MRGRERVIAAFKSWDTKNTGLISQEHLAAALKSLDLTQGEVDSLMSAAGAEPNGGPIEYARFVDWLDSGGSIPNACKEYKFFVGANWKCGLEDVIEVDEFIGKINEKWMAKRESLGDVEVCVFPPYVFLDRIRRKLNREMQVGSQNAWDAASGFKCTGVVSAAMLKSVGCKWVLLGHSDRRNVLGETNELLAEKVKRCLDSGLCVNLTIGETLAVREAGNAINTLLEQLTTATASVPADDWGRIAVAYEPVWAIGEGATPCSPEETQRVHSALRACISERAGEPAAKKCRLLYTGSVNEKNASQYASLPDVDGFVVGRAGLDADKLMAVCQTLGQPAAQ